MHNEKIQILKLETLFNLHCNLARGRNKHHYSECTNVKAFFQLWRQLKMRNLNFLCTVYQVGKVRVTFPTSLQRHKLQELQHYIESWKHFSTLGFILLSLLRIWTYCMVNNTKKKKKNCVLKITRQKWKLWNTWWTNFKTLRRFFSRNLLERSFAIALLRSALFS